MVIVIIGYSLINFVIQSIIQPKVMADAVNLSLTLTFVSLIFWTFVIGAMGAILAVPLTLLTKALLLDVDPNTRWISSLITGGPAPPEDGCGGRRGDHPGRARSRFGRRRLAGRRAGERRAGPLPPSRAE